MEQFSPWGEGLIKDYSRLIKEFGISPIDASVASLISDNLYLKRGMLVGHRDLPQFIAAAEAGQQVAILSGIKPTGVFHIGSRITADQMIYFQRRYRNARLFYAIADLEAYMDNGQSLEESEKIATVNVADMLALGMDPERSVVYMQSRSMVVSGLAFIFSDDVTVNMLRDIYGERRFSLYMAALVQAGDIFLPQSRPFGGPKRVLVPVGADQDPHLRLSRDLAAKHSTDLGLLPPSSVYHALVRSLTGSEKMSKRNPESMITLSDKRSEIKKKIMSAFTGGRATVEEQKRLGGEPEKCPVFDLYLYFESSDEKVKRVRDECVTGTRLCGECKLEAYDLVAGWIESHQARREKVMDLAKRMLEEGNRLVAVPPV